MYLTFGPLHMKSDFDICDPGPEAIQSEGADFWAKWILNAASKRQKIADWYILQSHRRD